MCSVTGRIVPSLRRNWASKLGTWLGGSARTEFISESSRSLGESPRLWSMPLSLCNSEITRGASPGPRISAVRCVPTSSAAWYPSMRSAAGFMWVIDPSVLIAISMAPAESKIPFRGSCGPGSGALGLLCAPGICRASRIAAAPATTIRSASKRGPATMRATTVPAAATSTTMGTKDQILEMAPRPDREDESVTMLLLPFAGHASHSSQQPCLGFRESSTSRHPPQLVAAPRAFSFAFVTKS